MSTPLGPRSPAGVDAIPAAEPAGIGLDRSLLFGIAWTGGAKWGAQLLSWISTLVVARLLTPADYGLVGMALVYLGFVQLVNEFGLGVAIIQRRHLKASHLAGLGGLSLVIGVAFFGFSVLVSPVIAEFFGEPGPGTGTGRWYGVR